MQESKRNFFERIVLTNVWCSIETRLEAANSVVAVKHEVQYRDESLLLAIFGKFGFSSLWCNNDQTRWLFNHTLHYERSTFQSRLSRRNRTSSTKKRVWKSREIKKTFLNIWSIRVTKFPGAAIESFFTSVWLPFEALIEGVKHWFLKNLSLNVEINLVRAFLNFRTIRVVMQGTKLRSHQWNAFVQVEGFHLRPEWKIENSVFEGLLAAILGKLNTNCAFWYSLNVGITERQVPREIISKSIRIFDPGETKTMENTDTQKLENVQFFTPKVIFYCRFIIHNFFHFFGNFESFSQFFSIFSEEFFLCLENRQFLRNTEHT